MPIEIPSIAFEVLHYEVISKESNLIYLNIFIKIKKYNL